MTDVKGRSIPVKSPMGVRSRKHWEKQLKTLQRKETVPLSEVIKVFTVSHKGSLYTVFKLEDRTFRVTVSLSGFSGKVIRSNTVLWRGIVMKVRKESDLHDVELIMDE